MLTAYQLEQGRSVKVGQVWLDKDRRRRHPVRVTQVHDYPHGRVVTTLNLVSGRVERCEAWRLAQRAVELGPTQYAAWLDRYLEAERIRLEYQNPAQWPEVGGCPAPPE